jgi:hypothetical protein
VKERISERVVDMLEAAIPHISSTLREPKVNEGFVVNVHVYFVPVREAVMCVVLVTPPF